jgi:hypothetical protein
MDQVKKKYRPRRLKREARATQWEQDRVVASAEPSEVLGELRDKLRSSHVPLGPADIDPQPQVYEEPY